MHLPSYLLLPWRFGLLISSCKYSYATALGYWLMALKQGTKIWTGLPMLGPSFAEAWVGTPATKPNHQYMLICTPRPGMLSWQAKPWNESGMINFSSFAARLLNHDMVSWFKLTVWSLCDALERPPREGLFDWDVAAAAVVDSYSLSLKTTRRSWRLINSGQGSHGKERAFLVWPAEDFGSSVLVKLMRRLNRPGQQLEWPDWRWTRLNRQVYRSRSGISNITISIDWNVEDLNAFHQCVVTFPQAIANWIKPNAPL